MLFPFANWDGVYFMHIAEVGHYNQEKFSAFFPGFPRAVGKISDSLGLGRLGVLLLGLVVNWSCFAAAAEILYALSLRVLKSRQLALRAAYLFCLTPAGIFMTSWYTER
jgi:Gpi18-like mannosyltransferase